MQKASQLPQFSLELPGSDQIQKPLSEEEDTVPEQDIVNIMHIYKTTRFKGCVLGQPLLTMLSLLKGLMRLVQSEQISTGNSNYNMLSEASRHSGL